MLRFLNWVAIVSGFLASCIYYYEGNIDAGWWATMFTLMAIGNLLWDRDDE